MLTNKVLNDWKRIVTRLDDFVELTKGLKDSDRPSFAERLQTRYGGRREAKMRERITILYCSLREEVL